MFNFEKCTTATGLLLHRDLNSLVKYFQDFFVDEEICCEIASVQPMFVPVFGVYHHVLVGRHGVCAEPSGTHLLSLNLPPFEVKSFEDVNHPKHRVVLSFS